MMNEGHVWPWTKGDEGQGLRKLRVTGEGSTL